MNIIKSMRFKSKKQNHNETKLREKRQVWTHGFQEREKCLHELCVPNEIWQKHEYIKMVS